MGRYVNLNQNRICSCCGKVIFTGTMCLTYYSSRECRRWVCNSCEELLYNKTSGSENAREKMMVG